MTNPEQREKIARDALLTAARRLAAAKDYSGATEALNTLAAIIALDPAPESGTPVGMKRWDGGDEAPADWDRFARVAYRNGEASQGATEYDWRHYDTPYDIIAYTPRPAPDVEALTRPIIGIENRTAQEDFDIMADRLRSFAATLARSSGS